MKLHFQFFEGKWGAAVAAGLVTLDHPPWWLRNRSTHGPPAACGLADHWDPPKEFVQVHRSSF